MIDFRHRYSLFDTLTGNISLVIFTLAVLANCQHIEHTKNEAYTTPIEAVKAGIESELHMPVTLEVETIRQNDNWAFLIGLPLTITGERIDYSNTIYTVDIREGYFDDGFVALVRKNRLGTGEWSLVILSIGATDAPFVNWPEKFGVPKNLIMPYVM